jgi:hypothetical protein
MLVSRVATFWLATLVGLVGSAAGKPKVRRSAKTEKRCGWIENPTPSNMSLVDRDGEWTIGIQGGYQAEGDTPGSKEFVQINGHYGYYCACLTVQVDPVKRRIVKIVSGVGLPLATCRNDKSLPSEPKP